MTELEAIALMSGASKPWAERPKRESEIPDEIRMAPKKEINMCLHCKRDPKKCCGSCAIRTGRKRNNINNGKALEMYQEGACDKGIAEFMGVTRQAVRRWRKRNGLPVNRR